MALEVSLWEAQAGSSARGSQMTASALASELMRQAFSGTSVLRSQPRARLLAGWRQGGSASEGGKEVVG